MKGSAWFRYMDAVLAVSGLNVYRLTEDSRWSCVEWLMRILSVMYTHLLLLHSVTTYVNRMDDPYSLLFLMQLFFGVVSFQSIVRSRKNICLIVEELVACCNARLLHELHRGSKYLFAVWLLVLVVQLSLLLCQWYFIGTRQWLAQYMLPVTESGFSSLYHLVVLSDIVFWVVFVIGFAVGAISAFLFLLYCLNKLYMHKMTSLAEKLEFSQSLSKNLECFREIRCKYQGLKEATNDIFGLTLCGYFAECYLETGLRLANDDSNIEKSLYSLVTDWGLYGLQVLILLSFILFLSNLSDHEETFEKRLLRKIATNRTRNYDIDYQKMMLIIEITQSPTIPVTGWNVFVVNRSLLLGFLGSVIPFAVLIASLFEKTKHLSSGSCSNYTSFLEHLLRNKTTAASLLQ